MKKQKLKSIIEYLIQKPSLVPLWIRNRVFEPGLDPTLKPTRMMKSEMLNHYKKTYLWACAEMPTLKPILKKIIY